jgi:small-conductance mechanosensitive channel/CRP-like cAMP-binding protein
MNASQPVSPELFSDAVLFTGVAVALAVVSLLAPADRRRGLVVFALAAIVMLGGLALLQRFGGKLGSAPYDVAREALLGLLAVVVIRAIVVFVARIVLGRFRVPHILIDVLFMFGMLGYAIYRLTALNVNLAGVVTTSAIVTGALAFSAGETLANLWAGLSLQMENTLRIGDWVRIEDRIGQVVSIRWRSMAIATPNNETIVVPNSVLMKDRIVVLGRHGEQAALYRRSVDFQVDYDYAPTKVIGVIDEALNSADIRWVAKDPPPFCLCGQFMDSGVLYKAVYYPTEIGEIRRIDSDVMVAVFNALARAGMPIPFPQQVVELKRRSREKADEEKRAREQLVHDTELFHALVDDERAKIAASLKRMPFANGDLVFRKGEAADSLFILVEGRVKIMNEDEQGARVALAELSAPGYFGEMGLLTGQPRAATVVADGPALCYRLGKQAFDGVLRSRPDVVEALAHVLVARQAENDATLKALDADARSRRAAGGAMELMRRIRHFFALPGKG